MSDQEDIRSASTPKGSHYLDPERYSRQADAVFAGAWHLLPIMEQGIRVQPFSLLPGMLQEPLLLTRDDEDHVHCLANVCTHRGMVLCDENSSSKKILCPYHGRRFSLQGEMENAPGFEQALNFPRAEDDLARLPIQQWGPMSFVSISPHRSFEAWVAPLQERLAFLPLEDFRLDVDAIQVFEMDAQWELYVENYLEGFHLPWVHKGLTAAIDATTYRLETFAGGSLQIATAKKGPVFELPSDHVDAGERIAAWYFHLFPNFMVNAYPWGLSVNVVEPLGLERTRVSFLPYVWRDELRDQGAGAELRRIELEDEFVVQGVHRGIKSRLYPGGRYSPQHEKALFAFHAEMKACLSNA